MEILHRILGALPTSVSIKYCTVETVDTAQLLGCKPILAWIISWLSMSSHSAHEFVSLGSVRIFCSTLIALILVHEEVAAQ